MATIRVNDKTREELLRYAAEIQGKLGRRISFDEAIMALIQESRGVKEARTDFKQFFGSLEGQRGVWRELEEFRRDERRNLERKARAA